MRLFPNPLPKIPGKGLARQHVTFAAGQKRTNHPARAFHAAARTDSRIRGVSNRRSRLRSLDERQQVGVDCGRLGRGHAVGVALVRLQRAVF